MRNALEKAVAAERSAEVLLYELNHRIRNNLSMVASVLKLQKRSQKEQAAKDAFASAVARVHVIANAHDHLLRGRAFRFAPTYQPDDARPVGCNQVRLDRREFRSASCRWKAISFHARLRRQCSISSPIPRGSTSWVRARRASLALLPQRPRQNESSTGASEPAQASPQFFQSCLLASIHRLVIRSSLSSRSAKSVASSALT
jgi:Histidine kinase